MLVTTVVMVAQPVSLLIFWRFSRANLGVKAAISVLIALTWFVFVFFSQ